MDEVLLSVTTVLYTSSSLTQCWLHEHNAINQVLVGMKLYMSHPVHRGLRAFALSLRSLQQRGLAGSSVVCHFTGFVLTSQSPATTMLNSLVCPKWSSSTSQTAHRLVSLTAHGSSCTGTVGGSWACCVLVCWGPGLSHTEGTERVCLAALCCVVSPAPPSEQPHLESQVHSGVAICLLRGHLLSLPLFFLLAPLLSLSLVSLCN